MEESESEIRIKTLTGESLTISISGNRTIEDLKLLLRKNFPSATVSPNFHLFSKAMNVSISLYPSLYDYFWFCLMILDIFVSGY